MLQEVPNTRQIDGETRRRWFFSQEQDLFVWLDDAGTITAFQLCYGKPDDERTLYWRRDRGYAHLRVDERRRHATPLLVADGCLDKAALLERFRAAALALPPEICAFVVERIADYPSTS